MEDNFIMTIEEQNEIINYAKNNYKIFDKNGYNKWKKALDELPKVPECIWEIKKRIIELTQSRFSKYLKRELKYSKRSLINVTNVNCQRRSRIRKKS